MKALDQIVIIPAYNEAMHIGKVIEGIKAFSDADIIVIDDGSTDQTAQAAERAGGLVIRHPFNMGYGVALQTGYKYAAVKGYEYLIQMDGDNQHDPKFIPEFFKKIKEPLCDVVIGSRFLGRADFNIGRLKLLGVRLFRKIIRLVGRVRITDPTSGFQCLCREVYGLFTHDSFPWDYPDANIIIMLLQNGFAVREIPVEMRSNPVGRSMHKGMPKLINYFFKTFLSIFIALIRNRSHYFTKEFHS